MSDVTLDSIASGYNLSKINNNFDKLENAVNNEILHTTGGNNTMDQQLDMDSNRIINLPEPTELTDPVRLNEYQQWVNRVDGIQGVVPRIEDRQIGDGSTTQFDAPHTSYANPQSFFVVVDGLVQRPHTDYTTDTVGKLDFIVAPSNLLEIDITYFEPIVTVDPTIQDIIDNVNLDTKEFASLEDFRVSSFSGSEATILAANAGTTTGRMILKATGTTGGTPTVTGSRFTALADDDEIINAGGFGFRLSREQKVSPQTFGALGSNAAADTPAVQLWANYCCSVGVFETLPGDLHINANIKFPLSPGQKVSIKGPAKWNRGTKFLVTDAACTRLFEFANVAESATHIDVGLDIEGICLDGNNLCTYGIWGAAISHASIERSFIQQFTILGMSISGTISGSYCNRFSDVTFFGNGQGCLVGYGSVGNAAANNNVFNGCKFWQNNTGAEIAGGYDNAFRDCLFEENFVLGAVVQGTCVNFDTCYFENNSATGFVMTTPSFTMHTDVYVKGGSSNTVMGIFSPTTNLTMINCQTYVGDATNGCLAYIAACQSAIFINNHCNASRPVPMIRTQFNNSYSLIRKLVCKNNENFTTDLALENYVNTILPVSAREPSWYKSDTVVSRNYANQTFSGWTVDNALGGNGGTWSSVSELYRGMPVYQLAWAATSLTYYARFALTATDYPELAGKYVQFSIAMKASGSGGLVTFSTTDFSAQATIGTDWSYRTSVFVFPASGTVNVGFAFTGLNGSVRVASPVLCELGADMPRLISAI